MDAFEYAVIKEKIDGLKTKKDVRSVFNSLKYAATVGDFHSFKAATYLLKVHSGKITIGSTDNKLLLDGLGWLVGKTVHTIASITEFCDTAPTLTKAHLHNVIWRSKVPYQTAAHLLNSVKVVG